MQVGEHYEHVSMKNTMYTLKTIDRKNGFVILQGSRGELVKVDNDDLSQYYREVR